MEKSNGRSGEKGEDSQRDDGEEGTHTRHSRDTQQATHEKREIRSSIEVRHSFFTSNLIYFTTKDWAEFQASDPWLRMAGRMTD